MPMGWAWAKLRCTWALNPYNWTSTWGLAYLYKSTCQVQTWPFIEMFSLQQGHSQMVLLLIWILEFVALVCLWFVTCGQYFRFLWHVKKKIYFRFLWRENATFAISRHYKRFDVFDEAEANKAAGKYDNASIDFQVKFYMQEGLTHYSLSKLPITSGKCRVLFLFLSLGLLFLKSWICAHELCQQMFLKGVLL